MVTIVNVIFISLSLLLVHVNAFTVVNNVTVSSDILAQLLIDEIQNNQSYQNLNITTFVKSNNYNTTKCIVGLRGIVSKLPSLDVLQFVDSWGKFPSGILYGHLYDLGNFDQCVRTSVNVSDAIDIVRGQYCIASVPLLASNKDEIKNQLLAISIGICVPDTCDPKLITYIFQTAASNVLNGTFSRTVVNSCKTIEEPIFGVKNIVGIVIFSIVGALMILSTAYDVLYTKFLHRKTKPLLSAFSILANGRRLFVIKTTASPNSIGCLAGIRVLSMVWVIYCHNYATYAMQPLINYIDMYKWLKTAGAMHVLMATVSVDSFLLISGLLVAWVIFPELDRTKGKLNVLWMYFHRYVRLTPPLLAVIIFYVTVAEYIGTGPLRERSNAIIDNCNSNWWSTILYVANYVHPDSMCIAQSWYLSLDTQLYILSPLILIPLWKWGKKFTPVMVVLAILSMGCIISTYYTEGYSQFMGLIEDKHGRLTYIPTHTRYSVWLVGVGVGYLMHKNKQSMSRPSKWTQFIAWILCFGTILAIIFGPYFTINADRSTTIFEAAVYEALKRTSWAIALSWIIFSCHSGYGGEINSFLSHPFWQPFSRMTYSMYLVHMGVEALTFGSSRTDVYFSTYQLILTFWGIFGISLPVALILTLSFESPVLVIEKALMDRKKSRHIESNNLTTK